MNSSQVYWFWWPITICTAGALSASLLYYRAAANDRPFRDRLAIVVASLGALALVVIPLALAGNTACNEDGVNVAEPNLALLGFAVLAWGVILCILNATAGARELRDMVAPGAIIGITIVGLLFEPFVAFLSLDNYCRTGSSNGLYGQAGAAILVAVMGGAVLVAIMRSLSPTFSSENGGRG
jgi:hypothetical protein